MSEHIGLDDDTNHNLTRRLMLLEESVSLLDPAKHDALLTSILDGYLIGYDDGVKPGVPRFLLNDVIRYWRTLAVDYQAKVWGGTTDGWGLRYLKLIVSRKLTFASTLASLLLCSEQNPARSDWLLEQFSMPSLARLAQLYPLLRDAGDDTAPLAMVLKVAEAFIASASDEAWRISVKRASTLDEAKAIQEFVEMRARAAQLQESLELIFFRTKLFGQSSQHYLAF